MRLGQSGDLDSHSGEWLTLKGNLCAERKMQLLVYSSSRDGADI